jgi:hypothetical protein
MNTCNSEVMMNRRDGYMELATLATGGISTTVARKSQMSPLRMGSISAIGNTTISKKSKHTHLSPYETSQTIHARLVAVQAEQANEHNEK